MPEVGDKPRLNAELPAPETPLPVERPDGKGRVLVIGLDHGDPDVFGIPFRGGARVEQQIKAAFGEEPLGVIIADSMEPLPTEDISSWGNMMSRINWYRGRSDSPDTDFVTWVLNLAMEKGAHLVLGDPSGMSPLVGELAQGEFSDLAGILLQSETEYKKRLEAVAAQVQAERAGQIGAVDLAANAFLGADALAGLTWLLRPAKDGQVSRRDFLKRAGQSGAIFALAPLVKGLGWLFGTARTSEETVWEEVRERVGENPRLQSSEDFRYVREVFEGASLPPETYDTPQFQRRAKLLEAVMKISLIFRNAYIAEISCLPVETLTGDPSAKLVNVVDVMGLDHSVSKNFRISTLVQDPKRRRQIIDESLRAIYARTEAPANRWPHIYYSYLLRDLEQNALIYDFPPDALVVMNEAVRRKGKIPLPARRYPIPIG